MDAFRSADQVLLSGVQGITDLITTPGLINLDFADVKSIMSNAGSALMGIGAARGDSRARQAAEIAIASPLLEASMEGAHGVLMSICGGSDLGLFEINEAATLVAEAAHPGREHHLRCGHRRHPRRRGQGDRHRRRLRLGAAALQEGRRPPRARRAGARHPARHRPARRRRRSRAPTSRPRTRPPPRTAAARPRWTSTTVPSARPAPATNSTCPTS